MHVRGGGFIQGYNTQNVTSEDGLIIATELTTDPTDTAWFEPMLGQRTGRRRPHHRLPPRASSDGAGSGQIGLLLADAGYCSEHNLTIDGPDRLIATGKTRHLEQDRRRPAPSPAAGTAPAPPPPP